VLRLLFVDHSVALSGVSPARVHYELLTVIGADNLAAPPSGTGHELLNKPLARRCRAGEDASAMG